jgi:hypothetical protein
MRLKVGFSFLYFFNLISKGLGFVFFAVLIKYMDQIEFSTFIAVYTLALSFTQGFSGLYERQRLVERELSKKLYISDNAVVIFTMQIFTLFYLLVFNLSASSIALILILNVSFYLFQLARIECQSDTDFLGYAFLDIVKNISWFILGIGFVLYYDYMVLLLLMAISCLGLAIYKIKFSIKSFDLKTSIFMYKKRIYLVLYSVATAVIPMLPMMLTTLLNNDIITSALGSSYRYQALLSLVVVTLNTIAISRYTENKGSDYITFRMIFNISLLFLMATILMYFLIPYIDSKYFNESRKMFLWLSLNSFISLIGVRYVNRILASAMYKHLFLNYFFSVIFGGGVFFVLIGYYDIIYSSLVSLTIIYLFNLLGNYFKEAKLYEVYK